MDALNEVTKSEKWQNEIDKYNNGEISKKDLERNLTSQFEDVIYSRPGLDQSIHNGSQIINIDDVIAGENPKIGKSYDFNEGGSVSDGEKNAALYAYSQIMNLPLDAFGTGKDAGLVALYAKFLGLSNADRYNGILNMPPMVMSITVGDSENVAQSSYNAAEAQVDLEISNIKLRLSADAATNVNRSQSEINSDKEELRKLQQRKEMIASNRGNRRSESFRLSRYKNYITEQKMTYKPIGGKAKIKAKYKEFKKKKYGKDRLSLYDFLPSFASVSKKVSGGRPLSYTTRRGGNQVAHYQPTGKVLSESRKIEILKNIKKPVVVRETKQKKYKVSPGKRFLEKRAKTNFQGMDKLVGDPKPQKSFKKPDNIWSTGWQKYNAKLSQGKKNIVLEKIGEGKQAWNYMLNHGAAMDAKNLEEFWGKNPDFYSYFFNGKKYRPIRKEQVKGDYIVFLVDEFGANSNMLQSELNAKLAEEDDKKLLVEYKKLYGKFYNKLDPISANSMPPTGDPEIDAIVDKQKTKSKTKLYDRLKVKIRKDLTNK